MKVKINIGRKLKIAGVLVVLFGLIAFAERMKGEVAVRDISIKIENITENHFLDEADIADLMDLDSDNIKGASVDKLNFKAIEKKIKSDPFVKDAELYSDLKGNLTVKAILRRPVARIMRNDGPDGYIAEDGTVMPVSDKYTSRVILLSGSIVPKLLRQENMNDSEEGKQLMAMLNAINQDDFLKAQITELDIDSKARVTLLPQIGDERIEFGTPDNLETKFKKLTIFYKEIIPRVGWNKYSRINLEFDGQIIAE
ncbi:MAG TPA: cell division protein FtsQ [Chryseosolibacter sp.]